MQLLTTGSGSRRGSGIGSGRGSGGSGSGSGSGSGRQGRKLTRQPATRQTRETLRSAQGSSKSAQP